MPIKKCSILYARPGMKLGRDVVAEDGRILLNKGSILTNGSLRKLLQWGIIEIFICQKEKFDALQEERRAFVEKRDALIKTIEVIFKTLKDYEKIDRKQIYTLVHEMILPLIEDSDTVFSYLHVMHYKGEDLFRHSINVAFYLGLFGKWLNFSRFELEELIISGLLHDIGKLKIPTYILNKPQKLIPEEMQIMKQHTILGYRSLRDTVDFDERIKLSILQHHERLDGSGYPYGLEKNEISRFARLIAIADSYDAITSERIYHKARSPAFALKILSHEMFSSIDASLCLVFIRFATQYLIGSLVELSNGLIGKIIYFDQVNLADLIIQTNQNMYIRVDEESDVHIAKFVW